MLLYKLLWENQSQSISGYRIEILRSIDQFILLIITQLHYQATHREFLVEHCMTEYQFTTYHRCGKSNHRVWKLFLREGSKNVELDVLLIVRYILIYLSILCSKNNSHWFELYVSLFDFKIFYKDVTIVILIFENFNWRLIEPPNISYIWQCFVYILR